MYEIQTGNENKILRTVAQPVLEFDEKLHKIIDEMEETMLTPTKDSEVRGIGLAANQVGLLQRIILITLNVGTSKKQKVVTLINPQILEISDQTICLEEGCLSLPDQFEKVSRPTKVKVRWQNRNGNWCERRLEKWDARVFLHEYDHLEGKLFVDYGKTSK